MSFVVLALINQIRQSVFRDGNYAVILLLVVGLIALVFAGYLIADFFSAESREARRRRKHRQRHHNRPPK